MWTQFWDMSSGGGNKERWDLIYVELPEQEAIDWFIGRFGHDPRNVTCDCCGQDYVIDESESLAQLTAYHRDCKYDNKKLKYVEKPDPGRSWKRYRTLKEYEASGEALIVRR